MMSQMKVCGSVEGVRISGKYMGRWNVCESVRNAWVSAK